MASNENVRIRLRTSSDVPTLIKILNAVYDLTKYPVDGPASFSGRFRSPKALQSFVALQGGTLTGHAELQDATTMNPAVVNAIMNLGPIESYAALVSLFVDPAMQGKGIGVRLVEEAISWGRANGRRLVLIVLDKDKAAIRMYEKMKWMRLEGVEYDYETSQCAKHRAFTYLAPV
jgi:GNAT superfamily N-acetyltransferase